MKKIEAKTLEEAYEIACREFGCSISELKYEVVQYPAAGFFGFLSKNAIIVAASSKSLSDPKRDSAKVTKEEVSKPSEKQKANRQELFDEHADSAVAEKSSGAGRNISEERVLESFFGDSGTSENTVHSEPLVHPDADPVLQKEIESILRELIDNSCFDIDTV
jgi:spoIIIJ-associated protein